MKKIILLIALAFAPVVYNGCQTAPADRVSTYKTLLAIGEAAKASLDGSTQLLKQGSITVDQWQRVATIYDTRFQPTYHAAVITAKGDLSSVASPDLIAIAAELATLVATFSSR